MPIYKIKLLDRREVAQQTFLFTFEKPEGFTYQAGQYGGFTLINPTETDAGGATRRFSLLSSPTDDHLALVTRIQNSAYKRVLKDLPIGSELKFAGPVGTFTLPEDSTRPLVLIAGGIGIAPFYCMIKHATEHKLSQPITLFYGNQQLSHAAFLPELSHFEKENPHFRLVATLDKPHENWQGEAGYITHTMIKNYVQDLTQPLFYVCGAPIMVAMLQELLLEMGIDEERVLIEDFPGY